LQDQVTIGLLPKPEGWMHVQKKSAKVNAENCRKRLMIVIARTERKLDVESPTASPEKEVLYFRAN
jgi:hypothetical protein